MNDQPCEKCQQPVEQMMQASSPFYTCSTVGCRFHIGVEQGEPLPKQPVINGWTVYLHENGNSIRVRHPTKGYEVRISKATNPLWGFFKALLDNHKE